MKQINDLQDFIRQQPTIITELDEKLVKHLITKITVSEDHFTIDFKSGVTIETMHKKGSSPPTHLPEVRSLGVSGQVVYSLFNI